MKTIMIIIAGMGDFPDPVTLKDTPLVVANTPSMDMLARRGEFTAIPSIKSFGEISHKNALLSILGYDLERGEPRMEELLEFGLNNSASISDYPSLRPFILPGFSGHGVCVTTSAWVRGVAKCALLKPLDIYSPGSSDAEILETVSTLATNAIGEDEFVLIYVDSPLKASLRGDYEGKIRALEVIDRHLVTPLADFVWKSDLFINMVITTDLVTPWHRKRPTKISVPVAFYYNNNDHEGDPARKFTEVEAMLSARELAEPSDLIRFLCNFSVPEDEAQN